MVYKGLGCIEAGRVPHSDCVYFKAICKGNTLFTVPEINLLNSVILYAECGKEKTIFVI